MRTEAPECFVSEPSRLPVKAVRLPQAEGGDQLSLCRGGDGETFIPFCLPTTPLETKWSALTSPAIRATLRVSHWNRRWAPSPRSWVSRDPEMIARPLPHPGEGRRATPLSQDTHGTEVADVSSSQSLVWPRSRPFSTRGVEVIVNLFISLLC